MDAALPADHVIFDCRSTDSFANGFLPGSIYAGHLHLNFQHLSNIIPVETPIIVLIEEASSEKFVREQLIKSGYMQVNQVLTLAASDLASYKGALDFVISISSEELALDIPFDENLMLVDVRENVEFEEVHFANTHSSPLSEMGDPANIAILPPEANIYLYCTDGERSLTAATILKRHGIHNNRVVEATWEQLSAIKSLEIKKSPTLN